MALSGLAKKWTYFFRIIRVNGGPFKAFYKLWRFDTLKEGTLMGTDAFGNQYYENQRYMIGSSRWVEYAPRFKWDYDASQVTAEWFGWLHYKTDLIPSQDCAKQQLCCSSLTRCWLENHQENMSGTQYAYYPYRTTKPYMTVWDGKCTKDRDCPKK